MEISLTNKLKYIIVGLVLTLIYTFYFFNLGNNDVIEIKTLGFFALIQFFYIYWSWFKLTGSKLDAYIIFMVACYAFNLGQPILELFDSVAIERSIILHFHWPLKVYCEASYISILFIMGFHIGAVFSISYNQAKLTSDAGHKTAIRAIYRIALILAIFTFPCYAYNTIIRMIAVHYMGYGAIYDENIGTIRIFQLIGDYYTPAIICLYFSLEAANRRTHIIWSLIALTVIFPPLYIGGRSNAIIILAVILIVYSFFHNISFKKFAIISVLGYFSLMVFAAIADNREVKNRSFNSFLELDKKENEKKNPALFTLTEMGASIQPLQHCLQIFNGSEEFRHGQSYFFALTTIIPNMGFWETHPATKYANLGNWLQEYRKIPYGPGFSIVAEAYYNFGYCGFLMMALLGFIFTKAFRYVSRFNLKRNPIGFIIAVVFLWFTIKLVRNSFEFAVRAVFYYCIPMYLLMKWEFKRLQKKY